MKNCVLWFDLSPSDVWNHFIGAECECTHCKNIYPTEKCCKVHGKVETTAVM